MAKRPRQATSALPNTALGSRRTAGESSSAPGPPGRRASGAKAVHTRLFAVKGVGVERLEAFIEKGKQNEAALSALRE